MRIHGGESASVARATAHCKFTIFSWIIFTHNLGCRPNKVLRETRCRHAVRDLSLDSVSCTL